MKSPAKIHEQHEIDEEILHYVREMEHTAPIRVESIEAYLKRTRRRKLSAGTVPDRVGYLVSAGMLDGKQEWVPGEGHEKFYTITAKGRDALDGVIPF